MSSAVKEEFKRAQNYVEVKLANLADAISSVVAEGMAYDLVILKNGERVTEVPVALTAAVATVCLLPSARLLAMSGLAFASFNGYTFQVHKKSSE